jgi:hypothetical protein
LSEEFGVPELTTRCNNFCASEPVILKRQNSVTEFEAVSDLFRKLEAQFISFATETTKKNLALE